jgi:hypothetical protein
LLTFFRLYNQQSKPPAPLEETNADNPPEEPPRIVERRQLPKRHHKTPKRYADHSKDCPDNIWCNGACLERTGGPESKSSAEDQLESETESDYSSTDEATEEEGSDAQVNGANAGPHNDAEQPLNDKERHNYGLIALLILQKETISMVHSFLFEISDTRVPQFPISFW